MPSRKNTTAPKPADSTARVEAPIDLAAMLERHLGPLPEPRRLDEFTVAEAAHTRKISQSRASCLLDDMTKHGILSRRLWRRNQYLYREVPSDERAKQPPAGAAL